MTDFFFFLHLHHINQLLEVFFSVLFGVERRKTPEPVIIETWIEGHWPNEVSLKPGDARLPSALSWSEKLESYGLIHSAIPLGPWRLSMAYSRDQATQIPVALRMSLP